MKIYCPHISCVKHKDLKPTYEKAGTKHYYCSNLNYDEEPFQLLIQNKKILQLSYGNSQDGLIGYGGGYWQFVPIYSKEYSSIKFDYFKEVLIISPDPDLQEIKTLINYQFKKMKALANFK